MNVKTTGRIADNSTYPWFTVKEFELFEYEVVITKKAPFDAVENIKSIHYTNTLSMTLSRGETTVTASASSMSAPSFATCPMVE